MEISDTKKDFLESLKLDINNLPNEFNKFNNRYKGSVKSKEDSYLFFEAPKFTSSFCMRDIVGTKHPDYENKSFFDSFLATKRGDIMINLYINNPQYYEKVLKQPDQSYETCRHDTPIELYKVDDENYYVVGGNNRINLMMMLYLADLSKAKTDKEKEEVYKKHTYYAVIKALPKNKKIVNIIYILKEIYKQIEFTFRGNNPDDCVYDILIEGNMYHVDNYDELNKLFQNIYSLDNVKDKNDLDSKLGSLFYNLNVFKYGDKAGLELIKEIYVNIEELQDLYIKAKGYNLLDQVDYKNIDYDKLFNSLKSIVHVYEENLNKEKISRANNYFVTSKNVGEFVLLMDDLISYKNNNYFEMVFNEFVSSYPEFKNMFLEVRDYLIKNHCSDVMEFTYDNIYKYIIRIVAEKKQMECEKKKKEINSSENHLNNLKKKLSIENNLVNYSITSSDIDFLNYEKDILEKKKEEKNEELSSVSKDLTENNYQIGQIKRKNIFLRIFCLKKLRKLEEKYGLLDCKMINNKDALLEIKTNIDRLSDEIETKKKEFSLNLESGITFDNFKLEQDRLNKYSSSPYLLEKEINDYHKKIIELYSDLESKKTDLDDFCKKHNIEDITSFKK